MRIGKRIGGAVYVHKSAIKHLDARQVVEDLSQRLPKFGNKFDVVKVAQGGRISFVYCEDFDGQDEPAIDKVISFDVPTAYSFKTTRYTKGNRPIYHHKWKFVAPDYTGFDLDAARQRSAFWEGELCRLRFADPNNPDYSPSRYGFESVWNRLPFNLEG